MQKPDNKTLEEWHKDPANWKLGIIYFNKKDKRIFPPKRLKPLGWTVNFANPKSILALLAILALVLLSIKFLPSWYSQ